MFALNNGKKAIAPAIPRMNRIDDVRDKPQPESGVSYRLAWRPCLPNILRWLLLHRLRLERSRRRRGRIRSIWGSLNGLTTIGAKCCIVGELRSTFRTKHVSAPNCPRASNQLTGLAHATQPETSRSTCKCRHPPSRSTRIGNIAVATTPFSSWAFAAAIFDSQSNPQQSSCTMRIRENVNRSCTAQAPSLRLVRPTKREEQSCEFISPLPQRFSEPHSPR